MDGVEAAVAGVGALVLAAPLARAVTRASRAGARAGAGAAATAAGSAQALGARGALAAGLGLGTAATTTLAAAPAIASPASVPTAGRPAPPAPAVARGAVIAVPGPTAAPAVHVVRRGECLWTIAAAHLGPDATDAEIARAWPRWYRANRTVIGPDPGLLLVGTRLRVPTLPRTTERRTGTSAPHHRPAPAPGLAPAAPSLDPGPTGPESLDPDRR